MIFTLPSALASPPSEALASSTRLPRAFCVSVAPAAAPAPNGTRPVAAGAFPVWLVQTDASGIEKCRMLVTSPAPVYFAKGTGTQWFLVAGAGVPAGSDAAYDVTIGDDPGDWLEAVPTAANGAVAPTQRACTLLYDSGPMPANYGGWLTPYIDTSKVTSLILAMYATVAGQLTFRFTLNDGADDFYTSVFSATWSAAAGFPANMTLIGPTVVNSSLVSGVWNIVLPPRMRFNIVPGTAAHRVKILGS